MFLSRWRCVRRRHQYSERRHLHVCGASKQLQEYHSSDRAYLAAPPRQAARAHHIASCCSSEARARSCPGGSKFSRVEAADKELPEAIVETKGTGIMLLGRDSRLYSLMALVMPRKRPCEVHRRRGMARLGSFCRKKSQTNSDNAMPRPSKAGPSTSKGQ